MIDAEMLKYLSTLGVGGALAGAATGSAVSAVASTVGAIASAVAALPTAAAIVAAAMAEVTPGTTSLSISASASASSSSSRRPKMLGSPPFRRTTTACCRAIFTNIARNIGELHRKTKFTCSC